MFWKPLTFLFLILSSSAFAEKAGKSEFHAYNEHTDWKCHSLKQVKLLQGSNGKTKYAIDVCVYNAQCDKQNGTKEDPKKFLVTCKLGGDQCLDLSECAKEQQEYEKTDIQWDDGLPSANEAPSRCTKPASATKSLTRCCS